MNINGIEIEGTPGRGSDRVKINLAHTGATPSYSLAHDRFTAAVFAHYDLNSGTAVVLMVNGNIGPTITNAGDTIIPFIQRMHLGRRGIRWKNVRWLYRDSDGNWDELVVISWDGSNTLTAGFRTLGDRSINVALKAASDSGFELDAHDRAHLHNAINDAQTTRLP